MSLTASPDGLLERTVVPGSFTKHWRKQLDKSTRAKWDNTYDDTKLAQQTLRSGKFRTQTHLLTRSIYDQRKSSLRASLAYSGPVENKLSGT